MNHELSTNLSVQMLPLSSSMGNISTKAPSHPDFSFHDATLAIVCPQQRFLVHEGLLVRHSQPFAVAIENAKSKQAFENSMLRLTVEDDHVDILRLLGGLYDGIYNLDNTPGMFPEVSSVLRMATKYKISHLRDEVLRKLKQAWPSTVREWDAREALATNSEGIYEPRKYFSHPIEVINLARIVDAPELLPAAFYDLSRCSPAEIVAGSAYPRSQSMQQLGETDVVNTLRGREQGSRFLSTFIVNELEGRDISDNCVHRGDKYPHRRRLCQSAFENITFEILRDVNGVVCERSADPLFAILDAELLQTKDLPSFRTCEACRLEFAIVVNHARSNLWSSLGGWFGIDG